MEALVKMINSIPVTNGTTEHEQSHKKIVQSLHELVQYFSGTINDTYKLLNEIRDISSKLIGLPTAIAQSKQEFGKEVQRIDAQISSLSQKFQNIGTVKEEKISTVCTGKYTVLKEVIGDPKTKLEVLGLNVGKRLNVKSFNFFQNCVVGSGKKSISIYLEKEDIDKPAILEVDFTLLILQ